MVLDEEEGRKVLRKTIHIDMDCFYAAIEMRDFPELANKPMAVGGLAIQRELFQPVIMRQENLLFVLQWLPQRP
ncbi:DNA-damage inducible protein P [Legionella oakridgensis]|nr:DNA-damage inducible protein P [Legionella oakridgensis]